MDPLINFGPDICRDLQLASSREWVETNGIGGFAAGTVAGINTRRYHAVLTAAVNPPLGRITAVSKVEETIIIGDARYDLSANCFPGKIHPDGYKLISSFRLDPFPIWTFDVSGISIEKRLFMPHGTNAAVLRYRVVNADLPADSNVSLALRPLISYADYHHLRRRSDDLDGSYFEDDGVIRMRPVNDLPTLYFSHNAQRTESTGYWYKNFEYAIEEERGFDFHEDLFQPFELIFDLRAGADLAISTGESVAASEAGSLESAEVKRRGSLVEQAGADDALTRQLVLAADQFIVRRAGGRTVIAGYPWFSDWGRDTMIALPGLTLATGRFDIAREIILEFSRHISEGMIPNRFPDEGETADYNTVDATLWYFEAIRQYAEATGDHDLIRAQLYDALKEIISWHIGGTRFDIRVDTDGLLHAGTPGEQLTWMDAKIGDLVITPRNGKPVEIQALWYNALMIMEDLASRFGDPSNRERYAAMADLAHLSFGSVFWNDAEDCLFDVVNNGTRDAAIRPNQIFAASLHYSMLDDHRARSVVDKVRAELLTPVGLRSLSPRDPAYVPVYIGSPLARDSAYHQGTVWAWLIGHYVDAFIRVYPDRGSEIASIVNGLERHVADAGAGQVAEIFDAEEPHNPRGCPAQAWSVAEILRARRLVIK